MAPRSSWKGHLKLSLVSCPVRLYNATSRSERISFNMLHKDTHNRVQMKPHDPELGEVERADLIKGYEYEKDRYVILDDEDFEKATIESTDTINIEQFVVEEAVDSIFHDSPYYLAPDGAVAEEPFRVIREAMSREKKIALARIVLSNRERLVSIAPYDRGFLLVTLRSAREVRGHEEYFKDIGNGDIDSEMLKLATQLIEQKSDEFAPSAYTDRYEEALLEIIKAKISGAEPVVAKAPERGKVINLMDALKRSLEESGEKPPAKSRSSKTATRAKVGGKRKAGGSK